MYELRKTVALWNLVGNDDTRTDLEDDGNTTFLPQRDEGERNGRIFTIRRLYLRAAFARVIRATYKTPRPLSAMEKSSGKIE